MKLRQKFRAVSDIASVGFALMEMVMKNPENSTLSSALPGLHQRPWRQKLGQISRYSVAYVENYNMLLFQGGEVPARAALGRICLYHN